MDLLRGGSIVAVVVGHWLVADLVWSADRLVETSALGEVPAMWPLTWLLVVIPLFFFVGGFSNRRSWDGTARRADGYATFLGRRVHRVLAPTGLYLAVALVAGLVVDRLGGLGLRDVGGLFLQPLWFLGVYLWVVALVPLTLAAHRRAGWWVDAVLLGLVVLGDTGRFALDVEAAGFANVLTVWLLMHQLGYHYADGALTRPRAAVMLGGGLVGAAVLVAALPYDAAMVGTEGGPVGNMHPPTLAITMLGFAQIGGAVLLRERLRGWLQRERVWHAVIVMNLSVITIYLWHQLALVLTARLVLPLGYPHPDPGTPAWWAAHLLWLVVPGAVLAGLVAVVGRAERVAPPPPAPVGAVSAAAAVTGVVVLGLGLLALAGSSVTEPFGVGTSLGGLAASPLVGVPAVAGAAGTFRLLHRTGPGAGGRALALAVATLVLALVIAALAAPA